MVAREVRLRYSSIINYAAMAYRMLVSVGFVIIVARRLSIGEFGLWGVILSLTAMLAVPVSLWGWWAQRMHARGLREASGTGLWVTLAYLVPGSAAYLAFAVLEARILGWGSNYMAEGLPIFMLLSLDTYLGMLAGVVKPELIGYKGFLYETTRISIAYLGVVILGLGLRGAIYAVEAGLLIGVLYMATSLAALDSLNKEFSPSLAASWIKGLVVPGIRVAQRFLREGVRAVLSWTTGSEVPVAYFSVGLASEAPLLRASAAISPALYARSLRGGGGRDLEESLRLYLLFTGFTLTTFTLLAKPLVTLYNPAYLEAYRIMPLIGVYASLFSLGSLYVAVLQGTEDIDIRGMPGLRAMMSSYLIKAPFIMLAGIMASYAVMVPSTMLIGGYVAEAEAAAVSLIFGSAAATLWLARETGRSTSYVFPWRDAGGVGLASAVAAFYYWVSGAHGLKITRFWEQAPILIIHLAVAGALYLAVLYLSSRWFRGLVKTALRKIGLG